MLLLFVLANMAEQEENYLVNICKALSLVALVHFIIGLSQFYDGAFTDIPGNFPPYSVMANRNFFGSAQVMLLPFVVFVLYRSSQFWKIIASLAIVGIVGSAILSQTRSSWIATSVMLVISMVLIIIYSPVNRKKWIIGTISTFVVSVLLGWFLISTDQQGEFAGSIKDRTSNMFKSDTASSSSAAGNVSERLKIWRKTMEVIKDNPVLGVGPGNWKIVVAKYGSKGLVWEKGNYIPDSTHNDYLLVTAESGIPGAIFYFGMWILIGWMGFKTLRRTQNLDRKILTILVFAGLAGYAFDSMFSFPMERMEHTLYLYLSGGIILGLYINEFQAEKKRRALHPALLAIMLIIAGFATFLGFKKMSFEKYVIRSKSLEEQKIYQQSVEDGLNGKNKFVNIAPNGFPIEAYLGLSYKGLKNYPEALKEMQEGLKLHPYNKALYVNIGTTFTDMGQHDSAIKYYDKALELTPKMDIIFFNKAASQYMLKDYRGSLETLNKADLTGYPNMETMKKQLEELVKKDSSTVR
jgi:O-antigen ligase